MLVRGSDILKVSPTASTIKQPGNPTVTVRHSDIAKFGTKKERQTPLKVYVDRRGPRTCEKLVEEQIQSHIKQFARKLKGDKKMNIENEIRAAEYCRHALTFHARCEGEFRKSQTLLLSEIKLFYPNMICHANWLFQNNRLPRRHFNQWIPLQHTANVPQIEIDEARHVMVLNRHQIQQIQPLPNVHAEREMLKIISLYLNRSSKLSSTLRINSRTKPTYPR